MSHRAVRRTHDQNALLVSALHTLHLLHELGLQEGSRSQVKALLGSLSWLVPTLGISDCRKRKNE